MVEEVPVGDVGVEDAVADLEHAVVGAQGVDLDAHGDGELRALLGACEAAGRRLQAVQTRVAGALTRRARAAAQGQRPGDRRAADRAAAGVRRDLAGDLQLSPSHAKQLVADDRRLAALPQARQAYEAGQLSVDHVRVLDRTLAGLTGQVRADLEARLVEAGRRQDPVAFGRTCRAALAELAPEQALADLDRQHARRSARVAQRPDGMTHLAVDVAGVDGAFVHATLDAFRRRDAKGEHRSAEQRTADAFMELVRAAAGTVDDPNARHGRPVFLIQLPAERLLPADEVERLRAGNGHETFSGPLPVAELTRLLGDAHVAALLADAKGLPLAVTEQKRGVPLGLWRQLVARDQGCTADGCDAPPAWCQVMHLGQWFCDGGMLTPDTSALGCTEHHRRFDQGQLVVAWVDGRPTLHPPDRPPGGADRRVDRPPGRAPRHAAEVRGSYRAGRSGTWDQSGRGPASRHRWIPTVSAGRNVPTLRQRATHGHPRRHRRVVRRVGTEVVVAVWPRDADDLSERLRNVRLRGPRPSRQKRPVRLDGIGAGSAPLPEVGRGPPLIGAWVPGHLVGKFRPVVAG